MKKAKIVLHLGGPKCGSSAIQSYLSHNPVLPMNDGYQLRYVAITNEFGFVEGEELRELAKTRPLRYLNSCGAESQHLNAARDSFVRRVLELESEKVCWVLSWEEWQWDHGKKLREFLNTPELLKFDLPIEAFMYIRPQVFLLNSGWWQWGAWSGMTLEEWIEDYKDHFFFSKSSSAIKSIERLDKLTVRVLPENILADFGELFQIEFSGNVDVKFNKSLPGSVLRLFQKQKHLRPSPHVSRIDFLIEPYVSKLQDKTPWVLSHQNIADIISEYYDDNRSMCSHLEQSQQLRMEIDDRWWKAEAFNQTAESPYYSSSAADTQEELTALLVESLADCEEENLLLQGICDMILPSVIDKNSSGTSNTGLTSSSTVSDANLKNVLSMLYATLMRNSKQEQAKKYRELLNTLERST